MEVATFEQLLTPAGAELLGAARALGPTLTGYPAHLDRLSKLGPRELARAALDTELLRAKAAGKFEHAERMFFTRPGYEMASGTAAARHRATRFRGFRRVADLGCGVGGDTVELAGVVPVCAFDRDALHARMTAANLVALNRGGDVVVADLLTADLTDFDAVFVDPGRRSGDIRTLNLDAGDPPVSAVLAKFPPGFPLAVKAAPGVPRAELAGLDAEAEFVSVGGELKECVLWFGSLRTATTRATVLPAGATLTGDPTHRPAVGPVGRFVFDPDPAVTRSGLVGTLADELGAHAVDGGGAFLSGDQAVWTSFASVYAVEDVLPWKPRKVGEWLRARGVGRVTPVKRGVNIDTDAVVAGWKLKGPEHRALLLMRVLGEPTAVVATRVEAGLPTGGLGG